jgi:hypothetical protein
MEKWNLFGKDYTEEEFWNEVEQGKIKVEIVTDQKEIDRFMEETIQKLEELDPEK